MRIQHRNLFFIALALVLGFLGIVLSGQQQSTNATRVVRIPIALLSEESATPVNFEGAVIKGSLPEEDKKKLEKLVGRVPYLWGKVESVVTCWPEAVVAAKVTRRHQVIFCVKKEDGTWHVCKIIVEHADRF